ncbi:hypothetical protein IVA79_22375 [Bradyrhizobium sp. 138]|uniref:hypothetical protein n=1 Tax=Bradyrhizobium sp. 138 TaxID=2782615 RepID=UPI001FFAB316|nr:hypothetical protein [Bradyrhizobium sp. 138]MCK1736624.1 hypothetical protein [Bradyrhizobium sp. 138]
MSDSPRQFITITTKLDSEPAHAEQLGHISVAWANVEWNMYMLFEVMSGSPPAVARSIFYAIDSNRGRREMLQAIARVLFAEHRSELNILEDILRRIGKSAGQRNKYVHDTWGVAQTAKREVFQMRMSTAGETGTMQEVTLPDMKAVVENSQKLADELNAFRERTMPKLPSLLEKYRNLPGLGLVYAPKGHPPGRKPKGFHGQR